MKKRIMSVILALALVLSNFPGAGLVSHVHAVGDFSEVSFNANAVEAESGAVRIDPADVTMNDDGSEMYIPLGDNLPVGSVVVLHLVGTAEEIFRGYFANDEWQNHNLTEGSAIFVEPDEDGLFDYTNMYTLMHAGSGDAYATRIILKRTGDHYGESIVVTLTEISYEVVGYEEIDDIPVLPYEEQFVYETFGSYKSGAVYDSSTGTITFNKSEGEIGWAYKSEDVYNGYESITVYFGNGGAAVNGQIRIVEQNGYKEEYNFYKGDESITVDLVPDTWYTKISVACTDNVAEPVDLVIKDTEIKTASFDDVTEYTCELSGKHGWNNVIWKTNLYELNRFKAALAMPGAVIEVDYENNIIAEYPYVGICYQRTSGEWDNASVQLTHNRDTHVAVASASRILEAFNEAGFKDGDYTLAVNTDYSKEVEVNDNFTIKVYVPKSTYPNVVKSGTYTVEVPSGDGEWWYDGGSSFDMGWGEFVSEWAPIDPDNPDGDGYPIYKDTYVFEVISYDASFFITTTGALDGKYSQYQESAGVVRLTGEQLTANWVNIIMNAGAGAFSLDWVVYEVEEPEPPVSGSYIYANGADVFGIYLPEEVIEGDTVTLHITGQTSDGRFRTWISKDWDRMSDTWSAVDHGFGEGDFDITVDFTCSDSDGDGRGNTFANVVTFKGASYGEDLDILRITSVSIIKDGVETAIELNDDVVFHQEDHGIVQFVEDYKDEPQPLPKGTYEVFLDDIGGDIPHEPWGYLDVEFEPERLDRAFYKINYADPMNAHVFDNSVYDITVSFDIESIVTPDGVDITDTAKLWYFSLLCGYDFDSEFVFGYNGYGISLDEKGRVFVNFENLSSELSPIETLAQVQIGFRPDEDVEQTIPVGTKITISNTVFDVSYKVPFDDVPVDAVEVVLQDNGEYSPQGYLDIEFDPEKVQFPISGIDLGKAVESISVRYNYWANTLPDSNLCVYGSAGSVYVATVIFGDGGWDGDYNFNGSMDENHVTTVNFSNLAQRLRNFGEGEISNVQLAFGADKLPVGTTIYLTDVEYIINYKETGATATSGEFAVTSEPNDDGNWPWVSAYLNDVITETLDTANKKAIRIYIDSADLDNFQLAYTDKDGVYNIMRALTSYTVALEDFKTLFSAYDNVGFIAPPEGLTVTFKWELIDDYEECYHDGGRNYEPNWENSKTHIVSCAKCGLTLVDEEEEHNAVYSEPSLNRHSVKCDICNYLADEDHTYDEDGKCIYCGSELPEGPVHTHDTVIFNDPNGIVPESCYNPWGSFGVVGDTWNRGCVNEDFTVEDFLSLCKQDGVILHYTFGGNVVVWNNGPVAVVNGDFDNGVPMTYINLGDGNYEAYITLDDIFDGYGVTPDEVELVCVQTWTDYFELYSVEFLVPYDDFTYADNGNGTHTVKCKKCGADVYGEPQEHVYDEDGKCVCGAVDKLPEETDTSFILEKANSAETYTSYRGTKVFKLNETVSLNDFIDKIDNITLDITGIRAVTDNGIELSPADLRALWDDMAFGAWGSTLHGEKDGETARWWTKGGTSGGSVKADGSQSYRYYAFNSTAGESVYANFPEDTTGWNVTGLEWTISITDSGNMWRAKYIVIEFDTSDITINYKKGLLGDINGDGKVNVQDGVLMQRILAKLETNAEYLARADLNGDNNLNIQDGVKMQRILAKLD